MALTNTRTTPFAALLTLAALQAGCSFVQLTPGGEDVVIRSTADIAQCESIGVVTAKTQSRVVIERGAASVQSELNVLARNEAATLGGNAIVPIGEPVEGSQSFRAYRCDDG